jgi:hypothetical protein
MIIAGRLRNPAPRYCELGLCIVKYFVPTAHERPPREPRWRISPGLAVPTIVGTLLIANWWSPLSIQPTNATVGRWAVALTIVWLGIAVVIAFADGSAIALIVAILSVGAAALTIRHTGADSYWTALYIASDPEHDGAVRRLDEKRVHDDIVVVYFVSYSAADDGRIRIRQERPVAPGLRLVKHLYERGPASTAMLYPGAGDSLRVVVPIGIGPQTTDVDTTLVIRPLL